MSCPHRSPPSTAKLRKVSLPDPDDFVELISRVRRRRRIGKNMFVQIWQFRVPSEKVDEFREVYGSAGAWAALFRRDAGFLGTELLNSTTHPNIFLTIDRWISPEAWAAFLRAWGDEYAALDRRCQELSVAEGEIGSFHGDLQVVQVTPGRSEV